MPQSPDWKRMADAAKQRRGELRLTQEDVAALADVGVETVRQIERHQQKGFRPVSLAAVSVALGWPAGSLRSIADGADPPEHRPDEDQFRLEITSRLDRIEAVLSEVQAALTSGAVGGDERRGRNEGR